MYRGENAVRSLYVICNRKLNNCLTNILLLQNQCCLLLHNHDRLSIPLCHICTKPLGDDKGRDHCHITGNCRGALKREFGKVKVIPQNMEKCLSLTVGQLKFTDSFQFTPQGLDSLVKTLEDDEFRYLSESFWAHSA